MTDGTEFCFDFIRHGQSTAQLRPDLIGGRTPGADLTPLGYRQAGALGGRLFREGVKYDVIYASPFPRALNTARTVCHYIGFPVEKIIPVPALVELDQGDWEGGSRAELMASEGTVHTLASWFSPPGGESQKMVQRRMGEWLECGVLRKESYRQAGRKLYLAVFAHGTALKCLLYDILEFKSGLIGRGMYLENCSLTRLRFNQRGWAVDCLNDTGHLVDLQPSREGQY